MTNRAALRWELAGIAVIFLAGSAPHSAFDWTGHWRPIAWFAPVNESVWEHFRLAFWPGILYTMLEYPALRRSVSDFWVGKCLGLFSMPVAVAVLFYGYTAVLGYRIETLVLKSCDGSRIEIDGQLVLDNDGLHGATERRATVALEKGWHRFECEWFRGYEPGHKEWAGLWLGWERPGGGLEEIPVSAWSCEDAGDLPAMRLVADRPTGQDANRPRIRPQIDARGASISRVVIFQNGLIWGESTEAPFEISGLLSSGMNRFRGRLHYNDGRTIDDPRTLEFQGAEPDLSPWTRMALGQVGERAAKDEIQLDLVVTIGPAHERGLPRLAREPVRREIGARVVERVQSHVTFPPKTVPRGVRVLDDLEGCKGSKGALG